MANAVAGSVVLCYGAATHRSSLNVLCFRVQEKPSLVVDLFVYLEDRGIRINKDGLQSCVASVAERIFEQYLNQMEERVSWNGLLSLIHV